MSKVYCDITVSVDGYVAGPNQSEEKPFGDGPVEKLPTFVTGGIESALQQAKAGAGDRDVAIAGGAATINEYLGAGHIDELRLNIAPVTVGAGEWLFDGVPGQPLELVAARPVSRVTHVTYRITP